MGYQGVWRAEHPKGFHSRRRKGEQKEKDIQDKAISLICNDKFEYSIFIIFATIPSILLLSQLRNTLEKVGKQFIHKRVLSLEMSSVDLFQIKSLRFNRIIGEIFIQHLKHEIFTIQEPSNNLSFIISPILWDKIFPNLWMMSFLRHEKSFCFGGNRQLFSFLLMVKVWAELTQNHVWFWIIIHFDMILLYGRIILPFQNIL